MRRKLPILLFGAGCMAAPAIHASTIVFTSFGPGYAASTTSAYFVGNNNGAGELSAAQKFSPSATGDFADAILDIGENIPGASHTVMLDLDRDNGGVPGSTLEEISVFVNGFEPGNLVTFDSTLDPLLTAGDSYWLVASADIDSGQNTNQLFWMVATSPGPGSAGLQCIGDGCVTAGTWQAAAPTAFEIDAEVASAPEPSSLILIPFGLLTIVAGSIFRQRRPTLQ